MKHLRYIVSAMAVMLLAMLLGGTVRAAGLSVETVDSATDVGYHSAITATDRGLAVSYYDASNDDLKVAHHDGTAWTVEAVDRDGNVGQHTAIVAVDDALGVSYYDATHRDLKVARYDGRNWTTETVDSSGDVGQYSAITATATGMAVSYFDNTNDDLKVAQSLGSVWTVETVDISGYVGRYTSITATAEGGLAVSYYDTGAAALKVAHYDGAAWRIETVDNSGYVGQYSAITATDEGLAVSYYDYTHTDLKVARYDGASWTTETVDSAGYVGIYTAITTTNIGLAVSYYDISNSDLKVAQSDGSHWITITVDSGGSVGQYTSITPLDGGRAVGVSYFDNTHDALKVAHLIDGTAPTTGTVSAPDISTAGGAETVIRVPYHDNSGFLDETSFGPDDLTVTGPHGSVLTVTEAIMDPQADVASGVVVAYTVAAPGGTWDAADNGPYTVALVGDEVADPAGNTVASNPTLAAFTVAVPIHEIGAELAVISPTGTHHTTDTMTVTWSAVDTAAFYYLDIWDGYGVQQFSTIVDPSACIGDTCSAEVMLFGVVGHHEVWMVATDGFGFSNWASSTFTLDLGATRITSPTDKLAPTASFELVFDVVPGASFYVIDIYRPLSGVERLIVEAAEVCKGGTCALTVARNYELGTFAASVLAGVGDQYGEWVSATFTVALDDVTLTAPTDGTPLTETLELVFVMPEGAYYVVLDVYYPNGGYWREVVEYPVCDEGICTVSLASYGLSGDYNVWMIPGWGEQFGAWALSSFSVDGPASAPLAMDTVDTLGSAVEAPAQLDTSAVEAAVEGFGN